jgi:hypothetical protein
MKTLILSAPIRIELNDDQFAQLKELLADDAECWAGGGKDSKKFVDAADRIYNKLDKAKKNIIKLNKEDTDEFVSIVEDRVDFPFKGCGKLLKYLWQYVKY